MDPSDVGRIAPPPPLGAGADAAWAALRRAATAPFATADWRATDRQFAWHFARGKLKRDPVFRALLARGDLQRGGRVVDVGCGQGILAALLDACNRLPDWPAAWPARPRATAYCGIELMARDVARAERALGALALAPRFVCADMRAAALPPCDTAVVLDALHYVDHAAQEGLLARLHAALAPGGRLVLRVGDAADRSRFRISQWVDRVVCGVRGHRAAPTWGRSIADWRALLAASGYAVRPPLPMSAGTPFANVLLVAERKATR